MTLDALSAPAFDVADSIFDFARAVSAPPVCTATAVRAAPEPGWATANPERAMLYLFVTPSDGIVADELMAR